MIDAQIPLMVRPPEIDQPVNAMAKILQLKQVQQDGQLGAAKLAEHQRGLEETNRLNQIYSEAMSPDGTLDRQKIYSGAAAQQLGSKIPGLQKGFAESDKAQADADKERIAGAMQKLAFGAQLLGGVRDQPSYDAARQTAQANKLDVSRMPAAYDPAFVQQKIQEGRTVAQQLDQYWKQKGYDTPDANARLSDARAREFNATKVEENRIKREQGKPLNEGQGKALLFGSRMREADKIIEQLTSEGSGTSVIGSRAPIIGGIINSLSSGNQQMLDQAKRDFMSAVLRRESGAAISDGEYSNADKQYFPQIGDGEGVIAQKAKNRKLALEGVLLEVPAQHRDTLQPSERQPAAPQVGQPVAAGIEAEMRRRGLLK